ITIDVVRRQETSHRRPLDQQVALGTWAGVPRIPTRKCRSAANRDARMNIDLARYRIERGARRVVEVRIDARRADSAQCRFQVRLALVVNGPGEAGLFHAFTELRLAAGDP